MKERIVGAVALGPLGKLQGGVKFFSLETGKLLNCLKGDYVFLLMPADVIKCINQMAWKSWSNGLVFGDCRANPNISDHNSEESDGDSDDSDYVPPPTGVTVADDDDFVGSDDDSAESDSNLIPGVIDPNKNSNGSADDHDEPEPQVDIPGVKISGVDIAKID